MPLECGETDHTVSNSFQNDVFSAHFTFQEKKGKEFLRLEGDIVIFKDIPKLKIVGRKRFGVLFLKKKILSANKESFMQKFSATMLFDNC